MKIFPPSFIPALSIYLVLLTGFSLQARIWEVDQQSPESDDNGQGSPEQPFRTINAAAQAAEPGDIVRVHAGVYREHVQPARSGTSADPITYEAVPGQDVVIRGSELWNPVWKNLDEEQDIREGALDSTWFPEANPYKTTISLGGTDRSTAARPLTEEGVYPETLGQLFVNGIPYQQVMRMQDLTSIEASWLVNTAGDGILVNFPPNARPEHDRIELSVRNRIFSPYRRGLRHITIRGFIFEHCANQGPFPQGGAVSFRSGRNWIFENNVIRFTKTVGLDCGSETWNPDSLNIPTADEDMKQIFGGGHLIRNNVISDNGLCGITGWNHKGTMVLENLLERNNRLGFPHSKGWEEWAAIKFHESDALIAGNIIRDNEGHGIWIDNGYINCHITRNVIVNNLMTGIFMELGRSPENRPLVSNNIIGYTRSKGGFYNGNGIYTHDASDIDIAHNLFIGNAGFGVTFRQVTDRKYGGKISGASNHRVMNNIFVGNNLGQLSFPAESEVTGRNTSNYNAYVVGWGGKGKLDFYINTFKIPVDWEKETKKLLSAMDTEQVPVHRRPNPDLWPSYPVMSLEAWRAYWDMDRQSIRTSAAEGKISFTLRSRNLELEFPEFAELLTMSCPPFPGVDEDFNGHPIEGDSVIPGPFQDAGKQSRVYPLSVTIRNPHIKFTEKQRERMRQQQVLEDATASLPVPAEDAEVDVSYKLETGIDSGHWSISNQAGPDPEANSEFLDLSAIKNTDVELYARAQSGPSKSRARVLSFVAPATGWYRYDLSAHISRRKGALAGYSRAELFVTDADGSNAMKIDTVDLNTPEGYKGDKLKKAFQMQGRLPMHEGWRLALRFQIVSPGPAPGGDGAINIDSFETSRLR